MRREVVDGGVRGCWWWMIIPHDKVLPGHEKGGSALCIALECTVVLFMQDVCAMYSKY